MKKQSIVLTSLLLATQAHAGWYTGLQAGVGDVDTHKELIYPLSSATPTVASFNNSYTSAFGSLLAGYQRPITAAVGFAVEGNFHVFGGQSRYNIDNWFFTEDVRAREKLEYGFGLFGLPQYFYNQSLSFFVGPGIVYSKFRTRFTNTAGNVGVSGNHDSWLTGWGLKLGAANQLSQHWDVFLSYQYAQYEKISWVDIEPLSGEGLRGQYTPRANVFTLGFKYHFPETVLEK